MSKMSELAATLADLKKAGEMLIGVAESLTELYSGSDEEKPEAEPAAVTEPEKEYSFIDVRKALTEKSRAGKTEAVKALLKSHGADKLSEVKPEDYAALIQEAEVL